MIVYGSSLSPFVFKVLAAAAEKGIPLELCAVGLRDMDPAFREASPFGKMPGFRDGDFAVSDSTAIIAYLEALHPEPPLVAAQPRDRARTIWFEEFADTILADPVLKIFFNRWVAPKITGETGDPVIADNAEQRLPDLFHYLEQVVPDGAGFLIGDAVSLADIAVCSQFVTLSHLGISPDPARYPRLAGYVDAMAARPSFADLAIPDRARFLAM